jgi:DNA-binding CsgD family transcriptional regulator
MNLIDFIHNSNRSETSEELEELFLKFLDNFGIDRFMIAELSHNSTSEREENLGVLGNYPEEWLSHYLVNHYVDHDPVYQMGIVSAFPFAWDEALERNNSKKSRRVMYEAKEFNLCTGIGSSIRHPDGKVTGIGFSGSGERVKCDKDALSLIHLASYQTVMVYSELFNTSEKKEIYITEREREVLLWISCGKTKMEIADILFVSESCIKRHCENLFAKLGVNNLPAAVAKAIRMGLII